MSQGSDHPVYTTSRLMMEIEIKFGKGRTDRVKIHYGDDPAQLAKVQAL